MASYVPYDESAGSPGGIQYVPYDGGTITPSSAKTATAEAPVDWRDQLKRQLGLTARAGITGITGTGAAIGDALAGIANLAGANLPMPSQAQQQMMTRLGLPEPKGALENVAQFGASALAGGMDPVLNATQKIAQQLAPSGFTGNPQTALNQTTQELRDAGYKLTPAEMQGGVVTRSMEGIGGSRRLADQAKFENQPITNDLAAKALNLPKDTQITADTLKNQASDLIKQGYEPIRAIPTIGIGKSYRAALSNIANDLGGSNSFPQASRDQVRSLVDNYLYNDNGRLLQNYTGADALKEIKLLRNAATQDFKPGGDALLGEARRRIATALEDNIDLSLRNQGSSASSILDAFREARKGLAKNFAVERMLVDPSTGVVSTSKAAQLQRSGAPLSDELATIAKAGGPMYSRATGVPQGGKPPTLNFGDSALGLLGLGLSHLTPASLAMTAFPAVRSGARSALLSEPMQNLMARSLSNQAPSMFGAPAANVLAAMPEQLLPLFSQGQQ